MSNKSSTSHGMSYLDNSDLSVCEKIKIYFAQQSQPVYRPLDSSNSSSHSSGSQSSVELDASFQKMLDDRRTDQTRNRHNPPASAATMPVELRARTPQPAASAAAIMTIDLCSPSTPQTSPSPANAGSQRRVVAASPNLTAYHGDLFSGGGGGIGAHLDRSRRAQRRLEKSPESPELLDETLQAMEEEQVCDEEEASDVEDGVSPLDRALISYSDDDELSVSLDTVQLATPNPSQPQVQLSLPAATAAAAAISPTAITPHSPLPATTATASQSQRIPATPATQWHRYQPPATPEIPAWRNVSDESFLEMERLCQSPPPNSTAAVDRTAANETLLHDVEAPSNFWDDTMLGNETLLPQASEIVSPAATGGAERRQSGAAGLMRSLLPSGIGGVRRRVSTIPEESTIHSQNSSGQSLASRHTSRADASDSSRPRTSFLDVFPRKPRQPRTFYPETSANSASVQTTSFASSPRVSKSPLLQPNAKVSPMKPTAEASSWFRPRQPAPNKTESRETVPFGGGATTKKPFKLTEPRVSMILATSISNRQQSRQQSSVQVAPAPSVAQLSPHTRNWAAAGRIASPQAAVDDWENSLGAVGGVSDGEDEEDAEQDALNSAMPDFDDTLEAMEWYIEKGKQLRAGSSSSSGSGSGSAASPKERQQQRQPKQQQRTPPPKAQMPVFSPKSANSGTPDTIRKRLLVRNFMRSSGASPQFRAEAEDALERMD